MTVCQSPDESQRGMNMSKFWLVAVLGAVGVQACWAAEEVPPSVSAPFAGKIGTTLRDSRPHWPQSPAAPPNAPNVVLILLDDAGFAATGTFGGLVATPALDDLAAHGLRYNRFHVTAQCSPTRAALLSG